MPSPAEEFHAWHDFYLLLGTAGATLIGAMFVVVSIGSRFMTERRLGHIHAFMTSTVVHLTAVVLASVLMLAPLPETRPAWSILACGGAAGIGYCALIARRVMQGRVDWSDPVWYAAVPFAAYAAILAAGIAALVGGLGFAALAVGPTLLLVAAIRNAWDMIVFFALREEAPDK